MSESKTIAEYDDRKAVEKAFSSGVRKLRSEDEKSFEALGIRRID